MITTCLQFLGCFLLLSASRENPHAGLPEMGQDLNSWYAKEATRYMRSPIDFLRHPMYTHQNHNKS